MHMEKDKDFNNKLLAFTFFYAVVIYVFCLGFYFWDKHIKQKEISG